MPLPQNPFSLKSTTTSADLLVAAHRATGLGTLGLFFCTLSGLGGVALTAFVIANGGSNSDLSALGLVWLWIGQASATYFCWASLQFGREMRTGVTTDSSPRYQQGFVWLGRMFWGVTGSIAFLLLSSLYGLIGNLF